MSFHRENEVVVILGSGRSGTSLLTNLLMKLGMAGVDAVEATGDQNPVGDYEDRDINSFNLGVFKHLGANFNIPLSPDFMSAPGMPRYIKGARELLRSKVDSVEGKWGFKDPKTASLLPLWIRAFNGEKITPGYVLAIRDPSVVVSSFVKNYMLNPRLAELVWLHRVCDSLLHTGGNCFIVHYEDWFGEHASKTAVELASYLDLPITGPDRVRSVLSECVSASLNRSRFTGAVVENMHVQRLYEVLRGCRGAQFDRDALMQVVNECVAQMNAFSGWWITGQELYKKSLRAAEKQSGVDEAILKEQQEVNGKLVELSNGYLARIDDLESRLAEGGVLMENVRQQRDEFQQLCVEREADLKRVMAKNSRLSIVLEERLAEVSAVKARAKKLAAAQVKSKEQYERIKESKSYRVAMLFRAAFKKPWPNMLMLPVRSLRFLLIPAERIK